MKQLLSKYIILLFIFIMGSKAFCQIPMTLYYMENTPQSSLVNPAMMPRANSFVSIPLINSLTNYHSDIALGDFIQVTSDGTPVTLYNKEFDYSQLYDQIGTTANIDIHQYITPLMFGFRTGRGYFTFSMTEKITQSTGIPADYFKFMDIGMPDNTNYDFSTYKSHTYYYREFSFGYSREITDKLTLGAHLKPLFGKAAIVTDIETYKLTSSRKEYYVQAKGDVYSSLPIEVYEGDENELPDSVDIMDMDLKDAIDKYGTSFSNPGFAVDLGAVYELNERWSFSGAIRNLGFISWKEDLNSQSFSGDFGFSGVNVNADNHDNDDAIRDEILDSLEAGLNFSTGNAAFKTKLSPSVYLGASYYVNHVIRLGFLSRSVFQKNNFRQEFNTSANFNLYKILGASLNYSINTKGNNYAGLGLSGTLGPLQLYILLDRIPTSYRNYVIDGEKKPIPDDYKSGSIMFGVNLVFGSRGFRDRPMLDLKN